MEKSKKLNVVGVVGGAIGLLIFAYAIALGASYYSLMALRSGETGYISVFASIRLLLDGVMTSSIGTIECITVFLSFVMLVEAALALTGGIIGNRGLLLAAKIIGIILIPMFFIFNIIEAVIWLGLDSTFAHYMSFCFFLPVLNLAVSILSIVACGVQNKRELLKNNPNNNPVNY